MSSEDLSIFDSRTLDRKLRSGAVSKKDYDRYIKGLADVAGKAAPIEGEAAEQSDSPEGGNGRPGAA